MSERLKITAVAFLVLAVVAVVVLLALRQWANGPADGTLRIGTPVQNTVAPESPKTPVQIQNSYFTAELPVGFTVKRQAETPDKQTRLQLFANDKRQQIAITVAALPNGGLPGSGSYNLRTTDTDSYEPYSPADMPQDAVGFRTRQGPPAFVVFWPQQQTYIEIALTSDGKATLDELQDNFALVVNSWEWR